MPAGGMACMASMVSAVQSPGALVASSLCFTRLSWVPLFHFVQGSIVIVATAGIAGLSLCRALVYWVGVATFVAARKGC